MKLDPAHYGDFTAPPDFKLRRTEKCPECGGAIEWADTFEDRGAGTEKRWDHAAADCGRCGLQLVYAPNTPLLRSARRAAAVEEWDATEATRTEQGDLLI